MIHREKVAFRRAFVLVGGLSVASGLFGVVGLVAAVTGDPQAIVGGLFMLGVSGVLALASVVGSVLRTIVTRDEIVLHAGIRHEVRIPLAGVTGIALTKYDADARQRVVREGKNAFAAIHPSKDLVRVEWLDASGKDHVAYVASEAPEALADILRGASAAAKGAATARVRVPDAAHEEAVEAEADVPEAAPERGAER